MTPLRPRHRACAACPSRRARLFAMWCLRFLQRFRCLQCLLCAGFCLSLNGPCAASPQPDDALTLSLSAAVVPPCGYVVAKVSLPEAAPDGADILLSAGPSVVNMPSHAAVLPGLSSATFFVFARPVRVRTTTRITARFGEAAATGDLTLTAPPAYTVTDLGTLGGSMSMATAINAAGRVAGVSRTADGWLHGFVTDMTGAMIDVAPDRAGDVHITALNDAGQVAGWLEAAGVRRAFATDAAGAVNPITVPGAVHSQAFAINNAGQVAGFFTTANQDDRAFWLTAGGTATDLGTFTDGSYSYAFALTSEGAVVGFGDDDNLAFAFRTQPGGRVSGAARIGPHAYGYAVNSNGTVAGEFLHAGGYFHAFRSRPDGSVQDLGTLDSRDAAALAINARGEVAGGTYTLGGPEGRAFLYTDGHGLTDLNDLIAPDAGWELVAATGINDAGQIAGYGRKDGSVRAYRLDPVVPPTVYGDADGSGTVSSQDVSRLLAAIGGLGEIADVRAADVFPAPSCAPGGVGDGRLDIRDAVRVLRRLHDGEPIWP